MAGGPIGESPPSTGRGPWAIADADNAAQLKALPINAPNRNPYRNDKRAKALSPILGPTYTPLSC